MKLVYHFFLLILLFASCSGSDIEVIDNNNTTTPISKMIVNRWVIKNDNITGFLKPAKYSQTIEFIENGNLKEIVYNGTGNNYMKDNWTADSVTGNWQGAGNKIILNDFNGTILKDTLYIKKLSADSLILSYQGKTYKYVPEYRQFKNIKEQIIGKWFDINQEPYKDYTVYSKDYTGCHVHFTKFGTSYMPSLGKFTWKQEDQTVAVRSEEVGSAKFETQTITFINEKYIGMSELVRIKMKEEQQ